MSTGSPAVRRQTADRRPSQGGILDGRSQVARRRRELIEIYTIALGGPDALTQGQLIDIRKASELVALAEQARAAALRDGVTDPVKLEKLIRLENTALRATKALNLPAGGATTKPETITDYAARKAAEKAAGSAGGSPT